MSKSTEVFYSPKGSAVVEAIPYPTIPLTTQTLLTDEATRCAAYFSHISGQSLRQVVSDAVKAYYDMNVDWVADRYERAKLKAN